MSQSTARTGKAKSSDNKKRRSSHGAALAIFLTVLAIGLWSWALFSGALKTDKTQQNSSQSSGSETQQTETDGTGTTVKTGDDKTDDDNADKTDVNLSADDPAEDDGGLKNGVSISERDGITYLTIQGHEMLLVNKSYHLPREYGDGITTEAQAALDSMIAAAAADGYTIWNGSGFRSYDTQEVLFNRYCERDGEAAASRYSARPGTSEHQTGLAMDIAGGDGSTFLSSSFENTPEFAWLNAHAADYGFILRYLKDKEWATGYIYEPWHYRYVGVELAHILKDSGVSVEEYAGLVTEA